MKTTWLARFFDQNREIIEAAETPFAKLAIFILPVLAPLVPATMTGLHLYKLFSELFNFEGGKRYAFAIAFVAALVLELLGYVGAISFIQSLFKWLKERRDEYLLPFALNGGAYVFYLIAMWLINVQLGKYFGTPPIVNNIFGLLSFITVPTGLLAANHLSQKEDSEIGEKIRTENRQDRITKYKIKHGMNPDVVYQQAIPATIAPKENDHKASEYKEKIWRLMDDKYQKGKIMGVKEITEHFHLPYDRAKGFVSTQRTLWAQSKNISLR